MADEWGYGRSGREQQEVRSYDPSWRDEMAIWLQRQLDGGQDRNVSRQVRNLVGSDGLGRRQFAAADFAALPFPGVVAALLGVDVGDDVRRGDYKSGIVNVAAAALPAGVQRWGGRFLGNVSRRSDAGIDGKDYWTKQHSLRSKIADDVYYNNIALRQTYQPTANGRYAGDAASAGRLSDFRGLDPVGDAAAARSRSALDTSTRAGTSAGAQGGNAAAGSLDELFAPVSRGEYNDSIPHHVIAEIWNRPGLRGMAEPQKIAKTGELLAKYADEYGASLDGAPYRHALDLFRNVIGSSEGWARAGSRATASAVRPGSAPDLSGLQIVREPSEVIANRAAGGIEMAPPPEWYKAIRQFHAMNKGNSTVHGIAAALGGAGAANYMDDY